MANDFLDDVDRLLAAPKREITPKDLEPQARSKELFEEGCPKCRGSGQTRWGTCFKCAGRGKKVFRSSPEARAQARTKGEERRVQRTQDAWRDFAATHQVVAEWIVASAPRFDFAASMRVAVEKYGSLTTGQLQACERLLQKERDRAVEREQRTQTAPAVDGAGVDRLKTAFDAAVAHTAQRAAELTRSGDREVRLHRAPRIKVGGLVIRPATSTSANPGALYVKVDGEYKGKIQDGRFHGVRACTEETTRQVLRFIADPQAAAKAYGQETGVCCICSATLRSEWRLRGIGPICAQKFGW